MRNNDFKLSFRSILRRGHYFYFLYYYLYGCWVDQRIAGRSMNATIFNHQEGVYAVQSISYPYLRAFTRELNWTSNDIFVDVGCAWGRLLGYLEQKTDISRFFGVEINHQIAEEAKQIFKNNSRVQILSGDILEVFPSEGTIFFLFNPFDEEYLLRFLDKVEAYMQHPLTLYYLHPTCQCVFSDRSCWLLSRDILLKPRCLAPLRLCEYRYDPRKSVFVDIK